MQVMAHRQVCVFPAIMVTRQCARSGHGALWKMTISYLAMLDPSSQGQSTTLSSSRTPSSSPILVRGSTATTCPTMSASSTSPTPPPGCATCSSWVRASRLWGCEWPLPCSGEIVSAAGGDYTSLAVSGGVVAVHIQWLCNLDYDFLQYCLPK